MIRAYLELIYDTNENLKSGVKARYGNHAGDILSDLKSTLRVAENVYVLAVFPRG